MPRTASGLARITDLVPSRGTERDWGIEEAAGAGLVRELPELTELSQLQGQLWDFLEQQRVNCTNKQYLEYLSLFWGPQPLNPMPASASLPAMMPDDLLKQLLQLSDDVQKQLLQPLLNLDALVKDRESQPNALLEDQKTQLRNSLQTLLREMLQQVLPLKDLLPKRQQLLDNRQSLWFYFMPPTQQLPQSIRQGLVKLSEYVQELLPLMQGLSDDVRGLLQWQLLQDLADDVRGLLQQPQPLQWREQLGLLHQVQRELQQLQQLLPVRLLLLQARRLQLDIAKLQQPPLSPSVLNVLSIIAGDLLQQGLQQIVDLLKGIGGPNADDLFSDFPGPRPANWDQLTDAQKKDLKGPWWAIGDQGQTSSCIGWALGGSVLRWHFRKLGFIGVDQTLSARYIWMAAKETAPYYEDVFRPKTFIEDAVITLRAALEVGRKFGVVLESELPFASGWSTSSSEKAFYARAARLKILSYYKLGIDLGNWRTWLRQQGPILALMTPDDAFANGGTTNDDFPNGGGLVVYDRSTATYGNHAVAVVGFDPNTGRFTIRNSWGTNWGDGGYAYASLLYVLQAFIEAYGVVVGGTEQPLLHGYQSSGT